VQPVVVDVLPISQLPYPPQQEPVNDNVKRHEWPCHRLHQSVSPLGLPQSFVEL